MAHTKAHKDKVRKSGLSLQNKTQANVPGLTQAGRPSGYRLTEY